VGGGGGEGGVPGPAGGGGDPQGQPFLPGAGGAARGGGGPGRGGVLRRGEEGPAAHAVSAACLRGAVRAQATSRPSSAMPVSTYRFPVISCNPCQWYSTYRLRSPSRK